MNTMKCMSAGRVVELSLSSDCREILVILRSRESLYYQELCRFRAEDMWDMMQMALVHLDTKDLPENSPLARRAEEATAARMWTMMKYRPSIIHTSEPCDEEDEEN